MAKNKKLSKLKCILKRWNSSLARTSSTGSSTTGSDDHEPAASDTWQHSSSFCGADEVPAGYRPVYVGKSRRRYVVSERLLDRPVFRNLLESSSPAVVGCEVVLFEHLLWMLDNADPKPDSLDELVEFYAC
ncbi:putative auxin-responsive protein SAUR72 [Iris pallida]|uniref:Auxin-responsive protein SAUR72 n=1 Tax=Iris pallida TaxID=29817 RepID=A0AAX6DLU1_IRIPA|nr:putative auxin-responsive protein SAUR72 [Iris pallida]KAJ6826923.1 putative auxin-responsive protein SAUR72 [Iris pallida]